MGFAKLETAQGFVINGEIYLSLLGHNGLSGIANPHYANNIMYVRLTLVAFALEMFLKACLLMRSVGAEGHQLEALFNALPPADKTVLSAYFHRRNQAQTLEECLRLHNNLYQQARYWSENKILRQEKFGKIPHLGRLLAKFKAMFTGKNVQVNVDYTNRNIEVRQNIQFNPESLEDALETVRNYAHELLHRHGYPKGFFAPENPRDSF